MIIRLSRRECQKVKIIAVYTFCILNGHKRSLYGPYYLFCSVKNKVTVKENNSSDKQSYMLSGGGQFSERFKAHSDFNTDSRL